MFKSILLRGAISPHPLDDRGDGKADRIINAAHAGRWVAYICACLEAKGLWTNVDTRHWIRMDVAAGNDGSDSHSTLGFLSYSSNVCYVTGSTTPPDGVTVDLGAKTWSFRGETYAIGSEREGHRCHDAPIGVYDLSDPCQFRRMIHYAGEATDSHCDGLVED